MFDRPKMKQFAKIQLKSRWTLPVLMTLLTGLIMILLYLPFIIYQLQAGSFRLQSDIFNIYLNKKSFSLYSQMPPLPVAVQVTTIISYCTSFICSLASIHVYLCMSRSPEPVSFNTFFEGFASWWRAIRTGIWMFIWTYLWSLLFIIPGIVKMLAYSQTMYLVAEYPTMPVRKAMRISIAITRGYKGDLFVLHLSFLGWALLATLSFGIGYLWLLPYSTMTLTNTYHWLLKQAVETNVITAEDLAERAQTL
ncbi:MAG: DUF975 family protein [Treponema sp.]|nr:DUF975 family protein [Treponema sp.]